MAEREIRAPNVQLAALRVVSFPEKCITNEWLLHAPKLTTNLVIEFHRYRKTFFQILLVPWLLDESMQMAGTKMTDLIQIFPHKGFPPPISHLSAIGAEKWFRLTQVKIIPMAGIDSVRLRLQNCLLHLLVGLLPMRGISNVLGQTAQRDVCRLTPRCSHAVLFSGEHAPSLHPNSRLPAGPWL